MPVTKNALIRYKVLDQCFRNPGRRYFIDDLIAECAKVLREKDPEFESISRRQIMDDISFMESAEGWSVDLARHKDGRKVFYRYADLSFSINNMPLNELEMDQLRSAIEILSQFKGMPQFEWVNEILPKLEQGTGADRKSAPIIEFDGNQYLKGIERLGELYNAIRYKKVLKIDYHPFDSEKPMVFTIHPYFLKQYNTRWFLFGYNPHAGKYDWNLALDRIVNVSEVKGKYEKNTEIDWQEYFEDMIGVTRPEGAKAEEVILQFSEKSGRYVESKPLHGSQKAKWMDGGNGLEVKLRVLVNYELESRILSFGESVKVVEPDHLRRRIMERLNLAIVG